jgi:tetratricopeptide (TPR) repeat protein
VLKTVILEKIGTHLAVETIKYFFFSLIPKIKEFLKKSDTIKISENDVMIITTIYKLLRECEQQPEILHKKELNELKRQYREAKEFFERFVLAWSEKNKTFLLLKKKSKIYEKICEEFIKLKKETPKQLFFVSLLEEGLDLYEDGKSLKGINEEMYKILTKLPPDYVSLIHLSLLVERFHSLCFTEKATKVREIIFSVYKEEGLKFSNLFQRGYLKSLLAKSKDEDEERIVEKIQKLLYNDSKYIFFIHTQMSYEDIDRIKNEIKTALKNQENYIAVHSLGEARLLAEDIVSEIEKTFKDNSILTKYGIDKRDIPTTYKRKVNGEIFVRDFSCIWWTSDGQWIYDLVSHHLKP